MVDHLRAVSGVGPCLGHVRACAGALGAQVDAAGVVGDAGRVHSDGQKQSKGVDPEMALATCDLLACVDALADCGHVGGGLYALRVQHAGTWFGVPPLGLTDQAPQQAVEPVEDTYLLPCGEVTVDGFPGGEVGRQVPPWDTGAVASCFRQ